MDLEDPPRLLEGRRCPTAQPVEDLAIPQCKHGPGTYGPSLLSDMSSMIIEGPMDPSARGGSWPMLIKHTKPSVILWLISDN